MPYRVPMVPSPTVIVPAVEEQYELVERKALSVDTGGQNYAITTTEPKVVLLVGDGCDMQVDTTTISTDSPKLADRASLSFTLKGKATTIYAKAIADSGTLYIVVFE